MIISITQKCNYQCAHCVASCTRNGQHMGEEVFGKVLGLVSEFGGDIVITGGEPTLHPEFESVVQRLLSSVRGIAPLVELVTNGSWVYSKKGVKTFSKGITHKNKIFVRVSEDKYHAPFWKDHRHIYRAKEVVDQIPNAIWNWDIRNHMKYPYLPFGRAESLKEIVVSSYYEPECVDTDIWSCTILSDGKVYPCTHASGVAVGTVFDSGLVLEERMRKFRRYMEKALLEEKGEAAIRRFCRNCSIHYERAINN